MSYEANTQHQLNSEEPSTSTNTTKDPLTNITVTSLNNPVSSDSEEEQEDEEERLDTDSNLEGGGFRTTGLTLATNETAKVIRKHLVLPARTRNDDSASVRSSSSSILHRQLEPSTSGLGLQGGAITREIYKWQFAYETSQRLKRSNSFPGLLDPTTDDQSESYNAHEILLPGGFRRHFIQQKAYAEGHTPNIITRNFIDFLALYGHFAGEDYPSDEDDSETETTNSETGSIQHPLHPSLNSPLLGEASPLLPERKRPIHKAPATSSKVFFLLIKSFLGAGVLFLPRAFYNGGMALSSFAVVVVSLLGLYNLLLLIECHRLFGGSYAEIANKLYGKFTRHLIMASVLCSQLGYCVAYTIFVAKNVHELILSISNCQINPSESFLIFAQLALYIPMSMVRKIKFFSMAAFFADLFIISGLSYLYYYDITKLTQVGVGKIEAFHPAGLALMAGTAVFAFEGVGLVLPIAESMEEPRKFPRLLSSALLLNTLILLSVGVLSYSAFGDEVNIVVLRNLPATEPLSQGVRLLYSLAVSFAVPLQLFPAIRILEMGLFPRGSGKVAPVIKWRKNLFRTLFAIVLAFLAYGGASHLERLVALVGAVFCVPLYFIFPALLHRKAIQVLPESYLATAPVTISKSRLQPALDLAMIIFGTFLSLFLTVTIIMSSSSPEVSLPLCSPGGDP